MATCFDQGFLRLFPGLPSGEAASFHGLRARGGFIVNASRGTDGKLSRLEVLSEAAQNCTVMLGSGSVSVTTDAGVTVPVQRVDTDRAKGLWMFATVIGARYTVKTNPGAGVARKSDDNTPLIFPGLGVSLSTKSTPTGSWCKGRCAG